ncbi:MAG: hypothetical protein LIO77_00980 [Rikenellaceae bacterium]|nr:hypothetical protein [Rikenellaceae bacterium]
MLKLAGYINLLISAAHFAALFSLENAFRLTGVAPQMARAGEVWSGLPATLTVIVAVVFAVFGIYALTAAGSIDLRLPLLKTGIYAIGALYVLRGVAGLVFPYPDGNYDLFQVLFALAALGIGGLYLAGGFVTFSK